MELLFAWIHQYHNFINKQGINLHPKYHFAVTEDNSAGSSVYTLTCQLTNAVQLKYADTCIQSITAIVGKNGSGKTSLLQALQENSLLPQNVDQTNDAKHHQEPWFEKQKRLLVYLCDNDDIVIYHNYNDNAYIIIYNM